MLPVMMWVYLIVVSLFVGSFVLGFVARGWAAQGPTGFAVVVSDVRTAALQYRPGLRVWAFDRGQARPLTQEEIAHALVTVLDQHPNDSCVTLHRRHLGM